LHSHSIKLITLNRKKLTVLGLLSILIYAQVVCCLFYQSHHSAKGFGDKPDPTLDYGFIGMRIGAHIPGFSGCDTDNFILPQSSIKKIKTNPIYSQFATFITILSRPVVSRGKRDLKIRNLQYVYHPSLFTHKTSLLIYH